ncbi:hypothetical protein WJX74_008242 [Apatococcus lobatus]|uniref:Uncharacterized protein n=1 Tax=Apatococcus lobatus TaxID=904363 RepID=A0AAW1PQT7_9CHLO
MLLDKLLEPQQDPVRTNSPICTFLDPEVISRTLDGLNYMAGRAEAGKVVERRNMCIAYVEGEAGLGKSTMAAGMHRGMQDMCRSPEGQLEWPHAAKLLNDPGATSQCLLNFSGSTTDSDQLAEADRELLSKPDCIWGIRIMARAHFKVSTAALRRMMKDRSLRVPPALWSMSNVAAFLRTKHQRQKLWLLELFVDEFPLIQEQAARFNMTDHELQRISKTLVYQLGYFAAADMMDSDAPPCDAARHGMVLLPGIFGTALGAIRRHSLPSQMPCKLQTLRALSVREGTELLRSRLCGEFGMPPGEISPQLEVFFCSDAFRAVMEKMAGVPGAIVTLTKVLTEHSSIMSDLQKYCKSVGAARDNNMISIGRQLLDRAMEAFGYDALSGAARKGLGGAKARLTIFLLAATGMSVERDLQIGESERQTLEEAACTGVFTLEPVPNRPGLTRVRMMPLRMEALYDNLEEAEDLVPEGLLLDDLVPHLQVPIEPSAPETMLAARLAAQTLLSSGLCGRKSLTIGDLLGAAKCSDPALLQRRQHTQE